MYFSTLRVGDELLSFTSCIQTGTQLNKICCSSLILFFTKLCHVWGENQHNIILSRLHQLAQTVKSLYIYKNWSITFIVATFLLSHIIDHINLSFTITLPPTYPLPFCFFISSPLSTLPLHFLHHFFFLIFLLFFSSFNFCINLILFLPFNIYFSHEKRWALSLSL